MRGILRSISARLLHDDEPPLSAEAVARGADGLIAQGREAGGHLVGTKAALDFLPKPQPPQAGGRYLWQEESQPRQTLELLWG